MQATDMSRTCTLCGTVVVSPIEYVLFFLWLFIITDKVRARGEDVKRCRGGERQRAKAGGWRSLEHTGWSRGRGYLRRGN